MFLVLNMYIQNNHVLPVCAYMTFICVPSALFFCPVSPSPLGHQQDGFPIWSAS